MTRCAAMRNDTMTDIQCSAALAADDVADDDDDDDDDDCCG